MPAGTWIVNALLTPFWWGLGLLILALLGDVWPPLRPRVSRLFDWLERTPAESPTESTGPTRVGLIKELGAAS